MNQGSSSGRTPKTRRGRETRDRLLAAAEHEFGERGFHDTAISHITQRAGVALGTFYVYFEGKEEIFRAVVAHLANVTRQWIAKRVADAPDRISAERAGIAAFLSFVRSHGRLYQIISEAQFVAEDAYRDYYNGFADAYRRNLARAGADGEIREGDYDVWAWALIGISVFLGMRFAAWDSESDVEQTAASVADFIAKGLEAE
jgi:AcrR family transcriptional regulator